MSPLLLALSLAAGAPTTPADAEAAFEAATARYLQGDWAGAAAGYERIAEAGFTSAPLFTNLGSAYLRSGRIGWAVLSYERALRLSPGDREARADLELARAGTVDRPVGGGEEPFLDRLAARLPDGGVTAAFAVPWLGLWGLLLWRRRSFGQARALLGAAAVGVALLAAAGGGLLALRARSERTPRAVVVVRVSPARESPEAAIQPAFELHEGTTVRVLEARGPFLRIRLQNGLEGWVARADLAPI